MKIQTTVTQEDFDSGLEAMRQRTAKSHMVICQPLALALAKAGDEVSGVWEEHALVVDGAKMWIVKHNEESLRLWHDFLNVWRGGQQKTAFPLSLELNAA